MGDVAGYETLLLRQLLEKVSCDGGYDFRDYKRSTVNRRLARRLRAVGAGTYREYMQFLDACPEEYHKLAEEITIKVSGFFRAPYCFEQVAKLVLPEIIVAKKARGERELRFWSTACARGEEPYSLAILLNEFLGQQRQELFISIQATDISRWALRQAEAGVYSMKDLETLPRRILDEYFVPRQEGYGVIDNIRNMVSFAHFDLTSAGKPPFTGVDCVFCCNVLIYLQRQLQERLLNMLYDALVDRGYLVLGEMETPTGSLLKRLECLDSKAKIYQKVTN